MAVVGRLIFSPLLPQLTLDGIGLLLNWLFVGITIVLVAWLGWWEKIRLTTPVNRRALVYLLPFAVAVFIPVVFGLAIPDVSLIRGEMLPDWTTLFVLIVGVALGAFRRNLLPGSLAPGAQVTRTPLCWRRHRHRIRPHPRLEDHSWRPHHRVAASDGSHHSAGYWSCCRCFPT